MPNPTDHTADIATDHTADIAAEGAQRSAARRPGPAAVVGLDVTHWECKVYYTETVRSLYPFPVTMKKKRVQTVYLDTVAPAK